MSKHLSLKTKTKTLFVLLFAVAALSSCRLRNTLAVTQRAEFVEPISGNKRPTLWTAFPDTRTTEKLNNFTDLSGLVQLQNLPVPHNLNILFMGDSLTRYQYLDLVYFLSHNGTWPSPDDTPNMVFVHKMGWSQFYNFTNSVLQPYEQCDCFRPNSNARAIENRYFYDLERNNSVTYLQKFGSLPFKSSWNVTDLHRYHEPIQSPSELSFVHKDWDWADAIRKFVCHMSPKPSVFIFNAGIWADHDLVKVEMQQKIVEALRACQIVSMYKTTTKISDQRNQTWDAYEQQLCNLTDYCMDLRWTALAFDEHYWDTKHFREPLYSMMNVQLLSLLTSNNLIESFESVS